MLLVAQISGDVIRIPARWWPRLAVLALFNIAGWNAFVLFGVQQMPAGRSAILAYTMPIWATLIATFVLREPLSRRKPWDWPRNLWHGAAHRRGDCVIRQAPFGAVMIVSAAICGRSGRCICANGSPTCRRTRCRAG
jgi:hypothetical protein